MGAILWTEHLSPRQGPCTQQLPDSSWRVGGGQSYPNPDPDPSPNPDPSPKQGQELYLGGGEGLKKHLGVHDPDAFYLPSGSGSEEALLTSRCNYCPVCPPSGWDRRCGCTQSTQGSPQKSHPLGGETASALVLCRSSRVGLRAPLSRKTSNPQERSGRGQRDSCPGRQLSQTPQPAALRPVSQH